MKKIALTHKNIVLYTLTFLIVVVGDQLTKSIIDNTLQLGGVYSIIEDFFYFTYHQNRGGAWGIFEGRLLIFYIAAIIATVGIIYYFKSSHAKQKITRFGLVLLFSGMIGNLIDRVVFGYVRDFIGFHIFGYSFPIFNVADIAISVGIALVFLEVCMEEYQTWKISKSQ